MYTPARPALLLFGGLVCMCNGAAQAAPAPAPIVAAALPPDESEFPASWWLDKALEAGIPDNLRDDAVFTMLDLGQSARAFEYISSTTGEDVDVWRANIYRRMVERFVASKDAASTTRAFQGVLEAAEFLPAQTSQQRSASAELARAAVLAGVEPALDRALSRIKPSDVLGTWQQSSVSDRSGLDVQPYVLLAVEAGHANLAGKLCAFALPNLFDPERGVASDPAGSEILIALAEAGKASEMEVLTGGGDHIPLAARLDLMAHFARTGNTTAAKKWRASAENAVPGTWTSDDAGEQLAWEKTILNDIRATFDLATLLHELKTAEPRQVWTRLKDDLPPPFWKPDDIARSARRSGQLHDEGAMLAVVGFIKAGRMDRADSIVSSWPWHMGGAEARYRTVLALAEAGRVEEALARLSLITGSRGGGGFSAFELQSRAARVLSEKCRTDGRTDLLRQMHLGSAGAAPVQPSHDLDAVGRFLGGGELEKMAYSDDALSNDPISAVPALARYADRRRLSDWIGTQQEMTKGQFYLLAARALARPDRNE